MTIVYRFTALLLLIAGSLMSQGPINTIPSWDGIAFYSPFGVPNTATYGQTISVAPGTAVLSTFAFEIGNCTANVSFRGEVYAWDGTKATASLFESPVTNVTSSRPFQLVTFNTGGLTLPPGAYVLFASTSRDQTEAPAAICQWGVTPNNTAYPGGNLVLLNNGPTPSQWTAAAWTSVALDFAFQVNMAPAPAPTPAPASPAGVPAASPATLLLGFAGVIALGLLGLSRLRTAR